MPTTATAMMQDQSSRKLQIALIRLFEGLRHFVRVHPIHRDDKMPEHDVVWVDELSSGPAQSLREAIGANPELWAHALPAECCIVHRETLKKYVGSDAAEYMAGYGANAVAYQAARLQHEIEMREQRERYER